MLARLLKVAQNPAATNRAEALRGLGELGKQARAVVPLLLRLADDPEETIRASVVTALSSIAPENEKVVASAVRCYRDPSVRVRLAVVTALAQFPPSRVAFVTLVQARADAVAEIATHASVILQQLGNAWLPVLLAALRFPTATVREQAAALLGQRPAQAAETVPALTRALRDRALAVRLAVMEALGHLGTAAASAVPRLLQAFAEPSPAPGHAG